VFAGHDPRSWFIIVSETSDEISHHSLHSLSRAHTPIFRSKILAIGTAADIVARTASSRAGAAAAGLQQVIPTSAAEEAGRSAHYFDDAILPVGSRISSPVGYSPVVDPPALLLAFIAHNLLYVRLLPDDPI
jgi:hypothetical protein